MTIWWQQKWLNSLDCFQKCLSIAYLVWDSAQNSFQRRRLLVEFLECIIRTIQAILDHCWEEFNKYLLVDCTHLDDRVRTYNLFPKHRLAVSICFRSNWHLNRPFSECPSQYRMIVRDVIVRPWSMQHEASVMQLHHVVPAANGFILQINRFIHHRVVTIFGQPVCQLPATKSDAIELVRLV